MPRYNYERLEVMCLTPRTFPIGELRRAVDYLKTISGADDPRQKYIGLIAETDVPAGKFRLKARPMLRLDQIVGKKPAEVWALFDADVSEQRKGLIRRGLGFEPVNWDEYL